MGIIEVIGIGQIIIFPLMLIVGGF